jgi:hypothetical protein
MGFCSLTKFRLPSKDIFVDAMLNMHVGTRSNMFCIDY